jgi:hypothetical protein
VRAGREQYIGEEQCDACELVFHAVRDRRCCRIDVFRPIPASADTVLTGGLPPKQ